MISDSCVCGATFSVTSNTRFPDGEERTAFREWLAAHAICRERTPSTPRNVAEEEKCAWMLNEVYANEWIGSCGHREDTRPIKPLNLAIKWGDPCPGCGKPIREA